jgi:hypothetical protein
MFAESHWASESHNHKGGWDIQSSGVFANHYDQIHEQCLLYLSKQQPEQGDAIPVAVPQPDTEDDSEELEESEVEPITRPVTSGSTSLGTDVDWGDDEAFRQEQVPLHSAPIPDYDDEDFSEEVPDVDTLAEPEDIRTTRRGRRLLRPSHIYSGRMPLPRSSNQPQVAPATDSRVPAEKQDSSDYDEEEPEEESGPVDLEEVWKQSSNTELNLLDLWLIVREEELPGRDPDGYLADVIRWTMQCWPGRDQLKAGSRSFRQHFKEIHTDYARHMGKSLSSSSASEGEQVNETPEPVDPVRVWKEVSDKHVSCLDFRDILRDEDLPKENPDKYLAKLIRWTMQSWPKRGELRFGSQNFARRFKEIQEAFALSMSGAESPSLST